MHSKNTHLESLVNGLRASGELSAWFPWQIFPKIAHSLFPTIRPPGDENNTRSSSIKWNTKERHGMRFSAGSAGSFGYVFFLVLATMWCGLIMFRFFLCWWPNILPLLDRLFSSTFFYIFSAFFDDATFLR